MRKAVVVGSAVVLSPFVLVAAVAVGTMGVAAGSSTAGVGVGSVRNVATVCAAPCRACSADTMTACLQSCGYNGDVCRTHDVVSLPVA